LYGRENFQLLSSAWFPSDAPPPRASGYRRVWFVAHKFAIQYNDPMVSTIGSAIQNQYGFTAEREFPDWTVFLYSADTSF
jgi:hypothetical protein